jgi:UDP-N-acetylglucosamine--N-acetylmuramyl-(pentapeptide) pyrophosphoryl-undecaprenol N-acetylglucosamine transferase
MAVARMWLDSIPGGEVLLVGAKRPLDRRILSTSGLSYRLIPAGGLKGKSIGQRLQSMILLALGVLASLWFILRFRPQVILGAGGYVSAPSVLAGWLARRPIVLMEQNARPGAANRWLSRFARAVALGFSEARKSFPSDLCVETGNPLRADIEAVASEHRSDSTSEEGPTLLVFGGSQGSHALNEAVCRALPEWKAHNLKFRVVHATGETDREKVEQVYRDTEIKSEVSAFLTDMPSAYRRADLAVTRAGALTVSELMTAGVPAVLVPLPSGADQHQEANASAAGNVAVVIPEKELETQLASVVETLLRDPQRRQAMSEAGRSLAKPGASARIAELCASVAHGRRPLDRHPH